MMEGYMQVLPPGKMEEKESLKERERDKVFYWKMRKRKKRVWERREEE
jgi:hypothetical protein